MTRNLSTVSFAQDVEISVDVPAATKAKLANFSLKEADFLNVCGTKYQDKNMYTKAISLYRRALKCVSTHKLSLIHI